MRIKITMTSGRIIELEVMSDDLIQVMSDLMKFEQFALTPERDEIIIRTAHIESVEHA